MVLGCLFYCPRNGSAAAYTRQKGEEPLHEPGSARVISAAYRMGGGIIYVQERIASFRNLFVLCFAYLFIAYKHSRTVFLIDIFSRADLKLMSITRTLKLLQMSYFYTCTSNRNINFSKMFLIRYID